MKVKNNRAVLIGAFLSSLLVGICAISSGSLWIDEFSPWLLNRADSISEWWELFQSSSDAQSPLYLLYIYAWTKLFGADALTMRASNVGLFAIANLALLWPFRSRPIIAFPLILTSCMSAPLWYYLNEIRTYIMFYMGASLMFGATIELLASQHRPSSLSIRTLCIGAVLASGANVLGIPWAGSTVLFILIYWLTIRKSSLSDLINRHYVTIVITVLCITVLIAHDIRMVAKGAIPTVLHESNVFTLLFSIYSNVGLLGVGPGMVDMRAHGVSALVPFALIIAFSALLFGLVAIGGLFKIGNILQARTTVLLM